MADESADPRVGQVIEDRYRILSRIASGGMGVVYRAERLQLGRTVAVKFLDVAHAGDDNSRARFEREARAMSRLSHPHCVSVIDFGVAETPFIVMDFVTGQPLVALIRARPIRAERAVNIMHQVAAGLAHAHRHEIIHRDIKPANIMLTEVTGTGDFVRILDFGLAKLRGASALSSANIVVGTPSYMSPEQGRGKEIDARSDIYSAGVVFYELLTGKKPFVADDAFEMIRMHQSEPVPLLGEIRGTDALRVSLDAVLQKAMAKKPSDRYQTALALGDAMTRILETTKDRRRPRGRRKSRMQDAARQSTQLVAQVDAEQLAAEEMFKPTEDSLDEAFDESTGTSNSLRRFSWLAVICLIAAAGLLVLNSRTRDRAKTESEAMTTRSDAASPAATTELTTAERAAMLTGDEVEPVVDAGEAAVPQSAVPIDAGATDASTEQRDAAMAEDALPDAGSSIDDSDEILIIDDIEEDNKDSTAAGLPDKQAVDRAPTTLAEAKDLLRRKKPVLAALGLRKMILKNPKEAAYHRLLGNANFDRNWRRQGILNYRKAIALSPRYRTFKSINDNAIDALAFKRDRGLAESFILKTLGKAAVSPLRVASRAHRSEIVRQRASFLLKRLR